MPSSIRDRIRMQIYKDKALLLKLRNPNQVLQTIPNSKQVGDSSSVLVKWGITEVQTLKKMGISAPSPITQKYKWPTGRIKPFDHQIVTSAFLTIYKRAFCFNEQGTGKTASAIWASDYLLSVGKVNRVLVICPLSIMESAWRGDLFTFAMHRTVDIAYGSAKKRTKVIESNAEYVIINYDGIGVVRDAIAAGGFDLIIIDEATHYKTATTDRFKNLKSLISEDTAVWMMTGTPAAQSPLDAFGLAKIINPDGVPRFFGTFRDQVMLKINQFKWIPRETATQTVFNALQPAIRFTKEECLDLPEIVYLNRRADLTPQQRKYYKQLHSEMVIVAQGEEVTAINAANKMNKLLQIAGGAVYTDDGEVLEFDISNRYKVMREVMDETTEKILIFCPYRHTIEVVSSKLKAEGITCEVIQGATPVRERGRIISDFQSTPDVRVLVLQPAAAAHGLTLTAANTIIWWSPISSLETYLQANARIHRAGQVNKCSIVHLEGSDIEHKVYYMLRNKIDIHTKIIDLYNETVD
jgi:SNF2 family DNA or RNA helicase